MQDVPKLLSIEDNSAFCINAQHSQFERQLEPGLKEPIGQGVVGVDWVFRSARPHQVMLLERLCYSTRENLCIPVLDRTDRPGVGSIQDLQNICY